MTRGSIYRCTDFEHCFIFLDEHDRNRFLAIMITTKWRYNNVPFKEIHFKVVDDEGHPFRITYGPSYFPYALLIKRSNVNGLRKVGELTEEGISFVIETLGDQEPETWEAFLNRT